MHNLTKMHVLKLSRKFHLLTKEQQLQKIREKKIEDSSGKSSDDSPARKTDKPETIIIDSSSSASADNEVVAVSSTSSNESNSEYRNGSVILNAMGDNRQLDLSLQHSTCKRTSCAGWKRLESTHIDHLEEVGQKNISLWTEDLTTIQEVDDPSTSFETARTHFTQSTQARSRNALAAKPLNNVQSKILAENSSSSEYETSVPNMRRRPTNNDRRRSVLGRNEVILLTSESDTSDGDDKENDAWNRHHQGPIL